MKPDGRIVAFSDTTNLLMSLFVCSGGRSRSKVFESPPKSMPLRRVKQELGVGLRQNIVLYVDDPIRLLEATVMNPAGGLFIPEPVVLSSVDHASCRVSVRSMAPLFSSDLPASLRGAVTNLHERILARDPENRAEADGSDEMMGLQRRPCLKERAGERAAACSKLDIRFRTPGQWL